MRLYKLVLEVGHVGSGRSCVATRHVVANDACDAISVGKEIPRVKRVLSVERVKTLRQFMIGLLKDICPIWFEHKASPRIVLSLIWAAYKLGRCGA